MVAHALGSPARPGHDRVIFLIGEDNLRSRRAIEKISAVLTERVDPGFMAGKPVRHVVYAIDRAGFEAGPLANVKTGVQVSLTA